MSNAKVNLKLFTRQLTRWLQETDIAKYSQPFFVNDGKRCYGRTFVVKKNNSNGKYAIFIREENKLKRKTDKELTFKLQFTDALLFKLNKKPEGISLLKTFSKIF